MSERAVFQPSSECLRELVLDYLLHNSYIETARAFARDTAEVLQPGLDNGPVTAKSADLVADVDDHMEGIANLDMGGLSKDVLTIVQTRREIKSHILSGRIDEAVKLLNSYFPSVIQDSDSETPNAYPPPRVNSPQARVNYTSQTSTKPVHIALNLRIQAFIEAARTIPLSYPSDPSRSSPPVSALASDDAHQTGLLHAAQRLYASVESLRDRNDKELYRKELTGVGGLLAYRDPESSPIAHYMYQSRREALADQVNSAILFHLGQPAISDIELFARQTTTLWSVVKDMNITVPSSSSCPAGILFSQSSPSGTSTPAVTNAMKGPGAKPEKADAEPAPLFAFHDFVNAT